MNGAVLTRAERIARLNDLARRAMGIACVVVATEGIRAMPEVDQSRLRELVETFDAFTPDNDPYGVFGVGGAWIWHIQSTRPQSLNGQAPSSSEQYEVTFGRCSGPSLT